MAMEINDKHGAERYAVVTGANKGIGFEIVRQLASQSQHVVVVLTARDENKGKDATSTLHEMGLTNVIFHHLDVLDPVSIDSLTKFIQDNFGRLDILVNNAGVSSVKINEEGLRALNIDPTSWLSDQAAKMVQGLIEQTYEKSDECLNTNYHGVKRVTEALLPLLQLSTSGARIVNISSIRGELRRIPSKSIRDELGDVETLCEDKLDALIRIFLQDLKENTIEANGWPEMVPAYSISKAILNAYTRILAKKHPSMCVNCVHPGFVKTDLNIHTGTMSVQEGAKGPVKCALLPYGGPTGCYFDQTQLAEF